MKPQDELKVLYLIKPSTSFILLAKDKEKVRSFCGGNYREEIISELWNSSPTRTEKFDS